MIKFLKNLFRSKRKNKEYEVIRERIDDSSEIVKIEAYKPLSEKEIMKIIRNELRGMRKK